MVRDEFQPAYLYHRVPPDATAKDLRGQKQIFRDLPVSLGGSASRIDVPAGTRLVIRATTDKPLRQPGVRITGPTMAELAAAHAKLSAEARAQEIARLIALRETGPKAFEITCPDVNRPLDVTVEFTDLDGVVGQRQLVIKPIDDLPPEVDVQVEVIRKTGQGYLITPLARIPFSGKVRDDHGLDAVEYAYTVAPVAGPGSAGPGPAVSTLQFLPGSPAQNLLGVAYLAWAAKVLKAAAEEKPPTRQMVASFARRLKETADDSPLSVVRLRFERKPQTTMLRDHSLDPNDGWFDVEALRLRSSDDRQLQAHYRLRLWLTATDNNIETGPGVGVSKERFTFLVVSENELIVEIAKEEEALHLKLEDTVNRLREGRNKLDQIVQELPRLKADEFSPMARRAEEVGETVVRAGDVTREVHTDYRRILKELEYNQVQRGIISRVRNNICEPLEAVIGREFVDADERLRELQKSLEERKTEPKQTTQAREALDRLIDRLARVLDAMGDVTTINNLIAQLVEIEKSERKELERLKAVKEELQGRILNDAFTPLEKKP
jgi:hypothetical protein